MNITSTYLRTLAKKLIADGEILIKAADIVAKSQEMISIMQKESSRSEKTAASSTNDDRTLPSSTPR